jgi:DNA transformation protein
MGNRKLTSLINIGKKIEQRLNKIEIFDENDLRKLGAVNAHKKLKESFPNDVLPLCYYLYAFEGALNNTQWDHLSKEKKEELKNALEK